MRNKVQPDEHARTQTQPEQPSARPDADLMRVDAPQASGPRVHTVRLLDSPGATLTVTCPDWCESDHSEDETQGASLEGFAHRGTAKALHVGRADGDHEDVLLIEITQYPFSRGTRRPMAVLCPSSEHAEEHLDVEDVYALARQARAYADALDELGVTLDDARRTARLEAGR
ncbi:DUF6907 domain-containing protein [Streptomyces sp. NPDC057794]|uniref:DUF6907 domain-containing protein n=1 Tax=Streptomyces sp. NPDC057794 TaxID=3346251 RepID=UPI0036C5585A